MLRKNWHPNEKKRLEALSGLHILGTEPEPVYDEISFLASAIADTPVAFISLVGGKQQWFKSRIGMEVMECPREIGFCSHTILQASPLIVEDAQKDPRFSKNPFVVEEGIRFYAGIPILDPDGFAVGALAVVDYVPRTLKAKTIKSLQLLGKQVNEHLRTRAEFHRAQAAHLDAKSERDFYISMIENLAEVIFQIDRDGVCNYVSPSISEMTGVSQGQLVGQPIFDLFVEEDAKLLRVKLLEGALKQSPLNLRLRLEHFAPSSCETVDIQVQPQRSRDGRVQWSGTMVDVSEVVRQEAMAKEQLETLLSVFEAAPFSIGVVELREDDIYFVKMNAVCAKAMGASEPNQVVRCRDLGIPEAYLDQWVKYYSESQKLGIASRFETTETISGKERNLHCSVYKVGATAKDQFVFVAVDVTSEHEKDRLLEEQKLRMVQSGKLTALGEMAAGVSHEINNPLAIIQSHSEIATEAISGERLSIDRAKKSLAKIEETVLRIQKIIRSMRNLARDGYMDTPEPMPLNRLLEESVGLSLHRFVNNGVTFESVTSEVNAIAKLRSVSISQAILNLLNNAFDAVRGIEDPRIRLELALVDRFAEIRVEDNGPGIPPEIEKRMFDPFFSTKGPNLGMGIGLSLAKRIIQDDHGELAFSRVNGWTRFTIRFPLVTPAEELKDKNN